MTSHRADRVQWRRRRVLAIALLLLASAQAKAAGTRIGVPEFEGAQGAVVRAKVMQVLQAHGFALVRSSDLLEAMALEGIGLDSADDFKTLAKELSLSAIVTGEAGPKRAKIVVHDGADGSIIGDASFSGGNPRKVAEEVELTFWKKLGPDVERGRLPAGAKRAPKTSGESAEPPAKRAESVSEGEASPGGESDEAAPPKKAKKKRGFRMEDEPPEEAGPRALPSANPWLDVELGVGGLNRSLTFNQNISIQGSPLLHPYSLGLGPIGVANVVAFPWLAGKVGNFGVEGMIQQGVGIPTVTWNGASYSESVHEYAVGFRYRVPFATTDGIFFSLKVGEDGFTFDGPNRSSLPTPDTIYHYTRIGTGMHVTIADRIGISFGGGYRYINNRGGSQISQDAFPHLAVSGADANVVARYALSEMFELRAGLEWRRYWYAMHSRVGDPVVAGGAVDQSFAFTAGIAVLLAVPSSPTPEGGTEAPPPPPPPVPNARPRKRPSEDEESGGADSDSVEAKPSTDSAGADHGNEEGDRD